MPQAIQDTESLKNFAADPNRYLDALRRKGGPLLLTVEGEPGVVVQDAASYQRFLEEVDRLEAIAAVKEGLQDVAAGRTRPMRAVMDELARKHQLPPVQGA